MQRILIATLLFSILPAAACQEESKESPGRTALEAARKARDEKLTALGLKDGQIVIQGPDRGEVEKIFKKISEEMPKIQKAWLDALKELNEKHTSDPAINKIRWEYVSALFQQGQGKEARKILALLGPSGLDLDDRLEAVQLLVNLGMQEKAATLLAGLDTEAIARDRTRHLVLAVLAATGQKDRALEGLASDFEGIEDGEEMWEIVDELENRLLLLPPSLHRPLLAALYEECMRRFPAATPENRKQALAGLLLKTGSPAIPIAGTDLEGKQRSLAEFQGKVLLVHFWASWKKDTLDEFEAFRKLEAKYGPKGFSLLGISLDSPAETAVRALEDLAKKKGFAKTEDKGKTVDKGKKEEQGKKEDVGKKDKQKISWPTLCDGKTWLSEHVTKYAVKRIPFSVLLDREGKVAGIGLAGKDLEARIQDLLD